MKYISVACDICGRTLWSSNPGEYINTGTAGISVVEKSADCEGQFNASLFLPNAGDGPSITVDSPEYFHFCFGECAKKAFQLWMEEVVESGKRYGICEFEPESDEQAVAYPECPLCKKEVGLITPEGEKQLLAMMDHRTDLLSSDDRDGFVELERKRFHSAMHRAFDQTKLEGGE